MLPRPAERGGRSGGDKCQVGARYDAPHTASYEIDLPTGATHEQYPDGSIVFVDRAGKMIAGLAAPWAADANGMRLETTFIYSEGRLTQRVVVPEGVDVEYPVVADPYAGKYLFRSMNTDKRWGGQKVFSGTKTAWGQTVHNGTGEFPDGILVGQYIMRTWGWQEWTDRWGGQVTSRAAYYQQYSCHVLGGFYNMAGDWNLEARADNSSWLINVQRHQCNW